MSRKKFKLDNLLLDLVSFIANKEKFSERSYAKVLSCSSQGVWFILEGLVHTRGSGLYKRVFIGGFRGREGHFMQFSGKFGKIVC